MGRIVVCKFDETNPDCKFFRCINCRTHIASARKLVCRTQFRNEPEKAIFDEVMNLVGKPEERYVKGNNVMLPLRCIICKDILGAKFIRADTHPGARNIQMREGRTEIPVTKLLFWDGTQLLETLTMLPLQ